MKSTVSAGMLVLALLLGHPAGAESPPALAWNIVGGGRPALVWRNTRRLVTIRLQNVGTVTWSPATSDGLAYHWRAPDGSMVVYDGLRTAMPGPVPPGATVELRARVEGPPAAGRFILEWEMVREGVRWLGRPTDPDRQRVGTFAVWRFSVWLVALLVATVAAGVILRCVRLAPGSRWWPIATAIPAVWAWAATALAAVAFSELLGMPLWTGGGWLVASGAALAGLLVSLAPERGRPWVVFGLGIFLVVLTAADLAHARYFGSLIPLAAVGAIGQLGDVTDSAVSLLKGPDAWLALLVPAGLALALVLPRRRAEAPRTDWERRARLGLPVLLFVAWTPALLTVIAAVRDKATGSQVFSHTTLVSQWGATNVHLFDVGRTVRDAVARPSLSAEERAVVLAEFRSRSEAQPPGSVGFGIARGHNLLLIQVESLQEFILGATVGGVEVTPFLNAVRAQSLYFPWVFDQSGEGRSSDGEFAALNSLHPVSRGAVVFRFPSDGYVALPAVLRRHGYATLSAHAFERGFWNRAVMHRTYGFDRSLFKRDLGSGEVIGWGLADRVFLERVTGPIEGLPRPFFTMLITLGLHHPFDTFPAVHKTLDVGAMTDTPLGNYLHAMHYLDDALSSFFGRLHRDGVLADTVVAIYGDHDAGIAIDESFLKVARERSWDASMIVRLRRVPLIIHLPGGALAGDVPVVGGHVDIAPTILYVLGIEPPPNFIGGVLYPGRDRIAPLWNGSAVVGGPDVRLGRAPHSGRGRLLRLPGAEPASARVVHRAARSGPQGARRRPPRHRAGPDRRDRHPCALSGLAPACYRPEPWTTGSLVGRRRSAPCSPPWRPATTCSTASCRCARTCAGAASSPRRLARLRPGRCWTSRAGPETWRSRSATARWSAPTSASTCWPWPGRRRPGSAVACRWPARTPSRCPSATACSPR